MQREKIAETAYLRIGGIEQWVQIRGEDVANPALVLLHGGPGLSETRFFRLFNAPLERSFTVVYWDQRGAGKSYSPTIPRASMTVERFVSDLGELVDAVCKRLGKTQVVIFGHSWGSALGVLYAARFPHKVAAYVGSGQYGDGAAGERASYEYTLAQARRAGKSQLEARLREIGPPPHTADQVFAVRTMTVRLEGGMRARALVKLARIALGVREASLLDLPRTIRGFRFSMDALWQEASRLNLHELAPALQMPVFFFLGRKDHWVPPEASVAYFEALTAPSKQLVWFEESGHEPFADEPEKFNAAMIDLVRPLCAPTRVPGTSENQEPRVATGFSGGATQI